MSGDAEASGKAERLARKIWLLYAIATITAALVLLAIYVNAYDDYDVGERLRGLGRFTRRAMLILSFPISLPAGALAAGPLSGAFAAATTTSPAQFSSSGRRCSWRWRRRSSCCGWRSGGDGGSVRKLGRPPDGRRPVCVTLRDACCARSSA